MDVVFAKDSKKSNPFRDKLKGFFSKVKKGRFLINLYYFLILLGIGFGFYAMMLFENGFTLAYGGDYSSQYIPMGYHVWDYYHEWIYTGHFTLFDPTVYLGVNSFGSNAYYGLFSPFNIIIVLLPREIVPYSLAICSIVKIACAGLFFSFFMRRAFNVKDSTSWICGITYAFAGWGAFYLWYNNYQDVLVFFPVVLLGVETVLQEKKPWILCVGVFFLTICNYVLMVPYIICAFFYAMFRFFQRIRLHTAVENFKMLGLGFIGFAGGLLMGTFVFVPALTATLASPKLEGGSYGDLLKTYLANKDFKNFFSTLFSWEKAKDQHGYFMKERVFYPILEFFFPATTCRSLPTMEFTDWDFDDMAVSLWCYIPMIMFLVPALIQSGKEKKWSHYIGFALTVISLFTPVMYYLTMGFTNGYARWTLFIAAILVTYVGIYIDKIPNVARWHIHVGFGFAVTGIVAAWIITYKLVGTSIYIEYSNGKVEKARDLTLRFIYDGFDFTHIAYIVELVYTTGVYFALLFLFNKKFFNTIVTLFVTAEAITMGNFVTLGHGYSTVYNNGYVENANFKKVYSKIQANDHSYYRVYSYLNDGWSDNNTLMNDYSSANFFHSLYNFEVGDFTLWTDLRDGSRSVAGNYRGKYQDLDNLLGVKYYFIGKEKSKYEEINTHNPDGYIANVPWDFEKNDEYSEQAESFLVYRNNVMNEFGYSYSTLYNGQLIKRPASSCGPSQEITNVKNAISMSTYAMISEEDGKEIADKYKDIYISSTAPVIDTIKPLSLDTNYKRDIYDVVNMEINDANRLFVADVKAAKQYPLDKIPYIPNYVTGTSSTPVDNLMHYFGFYTSTIPDTPLLEAGTTFYARAPFSGSEKYDFYFIDKDNKIFMYDAHDDDTTDNISRIRAFYIRKNVYKIAICGKYVNSSLSTETIIFYKEAQADYVARRNARQADPITDVKYSSDKFTFNTNNGNNRFIVSRVAYDKGWKITAKNNNTDEVMDIKVYKGNGGFVSFVAPKGNISYEMVYETPYLNISYLVTALSVTGFFTSMVGYHIYNERKRIHHLDKIFREN